MCQRHLRYQIGYDVAHDYAGLNHEVGIDDYASSQTLRTKATEDTARTRTPDEGFGGFQVSQTFLLDMLKGRIAWP